MPRISILMPVRNAGVYLLPAVRSILTQTFSDFEFVIVDDCSTDGALTQIEALADPRVIIARNAQQIGVAKSLNSGLERCSGKYICRMDADDISLPGRLTAQFCYLETHPDVGILATNVCRINAADTLTSGPWFVPGRPYAPMWDLLFGNSIPHPTVMLRHELVERFQLRYSEEECHNRVEDYEFWLRCMVLTKIERLDGVYVWYRSHESSTSLLHSTLQHQQNLQVALTAMAQLIDHRPAEAVAQLLRQRNHPKGQDGPVLCAAMDLLTDLLTGFRCRVPASRVQQDAAEYDVILQLGKLYAAMPGERQLTIALCRALKRLTPRNVFLAPLRYLHSRHALSRYRRSYR